jgi:hypothetical protein
MTLKPVTANRIDKRTFTPLAPLLDKRLLAYVAAASAAGIGLLAQTAEAKIVYTATNVQIPLDGLAVPVDINNDGVPDFAFYNFFDEAARGHRPEGFSAYGLIVTGYQASNQVWSVESKGAECAAVLPKGAKVSGVQPFQQRAVLFSHSGTSNRASDHCKWGGAEHRGAFLGLKFVTNGQTHYGWAHLTVGYQSAVINGFAYETIADKPILTGTANGPVEHAAATTLDFPPMRLATLGMLARGSRGLTIWRREEVESSEPITG